MVMPHQRQDHVLQALAQMLENPHRERVTTAMLATQAGVSRTSLYRIFPKRFQMFEALIEFIEQTLFVRINQILEKQEESTVKIEHLILLLLGFSQKNPGMTRILISDALVGEHQNLQMRIDQLHDRIEVTLKQALRFAITEQQVSVQFDIALQANVMMCFVIGRLYQFVKSGFRRDPLVDWENQRRLVLPSELFKHNG